MKKEQFYKSGDSALRWPLEKEGNVSEKIKKSRDEQAALLREQRIKRDELRDLARQDEEKSKKIYAKILGTLRSSSPKSSVSLEEAAQAKNEEANRIQITSQSMVNRWKNHEEPELARQAVMESFNDISEKIRSAQDNITGDSLREKSIREILPEELFSDIQTGILSEYKPRIKGPSVGSVMLDKFESLTSTVDKITVSDDVELQDPRQYYRAQSEKMLNNILSTTPGALRDPKVLNVFLRATRIGEYTLGREHEELVLGIVEQFSDEEIASFVNSGEWRIVSTFLMTGSPRVKELIEKQVEESLSDEGMLRNFERLSLAKNTSEFQGLVFEKLNSRIEAKYNLRAGSDVASFWKSFGGYDNQISANLKTMEFLESQEKESVKLLVEYYGIHEFHRYPKEMLLDQVRGHGKDVPYGVVIFPRADHNNAFDKPQLFDDMYKVAQGRHLVRVFEAAGKRDLARSMAKLRGMSHKIDFLILGAHGSSEGMQFGYFEGGKESLVQEDLVDLENATSIEGLLAEDCPVVLKSCSTGAEAGFAEDLSSKIRRRVQAPKIDASTDFHLFYDENGRPQLEAEYTDIKTRNTDIKAVYDNGKVEE